MNKFTKGPWTWHGDELLSQEYKAFILATRRNSRPEGANCQLIAAAPDLYEALQEMTLLAEGPTGGVSVSQKKAIVAKARAALSKATA